MSADRDAPGPDPAGAATTDVERIRRMAAEGRISDDEAERLIGVLREVDGVEADLQGVASQASTLTPEPPAENTPPDPAASPGAGAGTTAAPTAGTASPIASEPGTASAPGADRWLRVAMLAGDLDIEVDSALDAPAVRGDGDFELETTSEGFLLRQFSGDGNLLERLVRGVRRSSLAVRVPPGTGVDLQVKAGDVKVRGVPFLRGHLLAGDLDGRELGGVDLAVSAGDVDLQLRPTEGAHSLRVTAGDVHLRLLPGSSARLSGQVTIGDLSVSGPLQQTRQGVGCRLHGTVGGGAATLDVRQAVGDLTVDAPAAAADAAGNTGTNAHG